MKNLYGFKNFFEIMSAPMMPRPDQRIFSQDISDQPAFGHGKDGAMDSTSVQSMELGVPEKTFQSLPFAGGNIQIGRQIMMGTSSMEVLKITDKVVTLRVHDDGIKRFVKTPGSLYINPNKGQEKIITIPRAYFTQMMDSQYGNSGGAVAGPPGAGGGLPPL